MKKYELIKSVASVCEILAKNNVSVNDVKYLLAYEDYKRLQREGHKYDFIVYYIEQQYSVKATTLWRLVKRLDEEVKL